jgi:hypothetical protein
MIEKILEGFLNLSDNSKWIAVIVAVLVCAVVWEVFITMVRQLSRAVRGLDNDK